MAGRNSFKSGSCEMLVLHISKNYGDCYAYQISQLISDYKKQVGKRLTRVYYHLESAGEERLAHLLD